MTLIERQASCTCNVRDNSEVVLKQFGMQPVVLSVLVVMYGTVGEEETDNSDEHGPSP